MGVEEATTFSSEMAGKTVATRMAKTDASKAARSSTRNADLGTMHLDAVFAAPCAHLDGKTLASVARSLDTQSTKLRIARKSTARATAKSASSWPILNAEQISTPLAAMSAAQIAQVA